MAFSTSLCIKPFSSRHPRRLQHDDPSSPKVGCMGQVRRRKPAENSAAAPPLHPPRHSDRRRFNFLMATVGLFVCPVNSKKFTTRSKKPAPRGRRVMAVEEIEASLLVAVAEMDPPLPVAAVGKKEREMKTQAVSLWKRRCRSRKLEELIFCHHEKLPVVIAGMVV